MTVSELIPIRDDVRLRILNTPGPGRPFLLVHGLSSNARLWDGVTAVLAAAGHRVVAVDLRSHGESDSPEDGYDTATAAADLGVLMAELDLGGAVVAGQSWGGSVVVELAALAADAASAGPGTAAPTAFADPKHAPAALALVDGGWLDLTTEFADWDSCRVALTPPSLDGIQAAALRSYLRADHADWEDWAVDATMANFRISAAGELARRLPIDKHMLIVRSMWDGPPTRRLPRVRIPVTMIPAYRSGARGLRAATQEQRVASAAGLLADVVVRPYAGADHDIHAQHPQSLAADLLALAERVR